MAEAAVPTTSGSIAAAPAPARSLGREAGGMTLAAVGLLVLLIPSQFSFEVGPFLVTPLRLFLILASAAIFARFFSLHLRSYDYFYFAFVFWTILCIVYNRGSASLAPSGQFFLEFGMMYMLTRAYVRTPEQLETIARILLISIFILMFFAIFEAFIIKTPYLNDFFNSLVGKPVREWRTGDGRFGLRRARTIFVHPILFGLYCASALGLAYWTLKTAAMRAFACVTILFTTFTSVSSGPFLGCLIQLAMIGAFYAMRMTKVTLKQVLIVLVGIIVLLNMTTGRGAIGMIELLTFNSQTYHYRKLIWNHGIDDVMSHPWLGMRPENWTRLFWMKSSIDNFWLFQAMRGGIPSVIFLAASIILMTRLMFRGVYDADVGDRIGSARRAWACTMTAMVFAGMAVHLFDKIQPYFAYLVGMGGAVAAMTREAADRGGVAAEAAPTPARTRAILG